MMDFTNSRAVNDAPTIDDIDASKTGALIGYWKCSDADIANGIVPDHSGNGYDLQLTCTPENKPISSQNCGSTAGAITIVNGFMKLQNKWAVLVNAAGTLLDTGTKHVVFGCEYYNDDGSSDSDFGGAWAGGHYPSDADYLQGFQLGAFGLILFSRIAWRDPTERSLVSPAALNDIQSGESVNMYAGFRPSTSLATAWRVNRNGGTTEDGFEVDSTPSGGTIPSTLTNQNNMFGFRATGADSSPIKNYMVWAFDSEPSDMNSTLKWMSRNPGRIPPNWIGK